VPLDSDIGADFFGLSHPTVQYLIQSCPKARSCANYQWTKFEVGRRGELPEVRVDDKASVAASILETMQGTPASLASCLLQQQHTEQLNIKVEPV
jgi:F/Y rich C-terminus